MKVGAVLLIFTLLPAYAEDWTVDGKDYHNVVVNQVEADCVHITYDGGIGSVPLADLSPALQKRFGYDPGKAKAVADAKETRAAELDREHIIVATQQERAAEADESMDKITDEALAGWVVEVRKEALEASTQEAQSRVAIQQCRLQAFHVLLAKWAALGASDQAVLKRWIDCVMTNKICVGMPKLLVIMAWGNPQSSTTSTSAYGDDLEIQHYENYSSTVSISGGYVSDITQTETTSN